MEIKFTARQVWSVLQVLSWIIFIGLCIEAGGMVVNTIITLFINPSGVHNFWEGAAYLSALHRFDRGHFFVVVLIMVIVAILKAILFFVIVKQFTDKKLNISQPFTLDFKHFLSHLTYLALGIGLFCHAGWRYLTWLTTQGAGTPDLQALHIAGADVWLFMAVILFVIVQVVKRGIEIQRENDLTI